jgi:hypothetical protein
MVPTLLSGLSTKCYLLAYPKIIDGVRFPQEFNFLARG